MHIVFVHIHVKPECIEAFKQATLDNARNSLKEEGIFRFDFLQMGDDASKFVLVEVYKNPDAQLKHRETAHYNIWKEHVADMMAGPRQGIKYINILPEDGDWKKV